MTYRGFFLSAFGAKREPATLVGGGTSRSLTPGEGQSRDMVEPFGTKGPAMQADERGGASRERFGRRTPCIVVNQLYRTTKAQAKIQAPKSNTPECGSSFFLSLLWYPPGAETQS